MSAPLVRVFDSFDVAERARNALIIAGLLPEAIELRPPEDDGGPVEGNFLIDLEEKPTPANDDPHRQTPQAELRTPVSRATYVMMVSATDEQQARQAAQVLDSFSAVDTGERLSSRAQSP
jgi:hypothetical protein